MPFALLSLALLPTASVRVCVIGGGVSGLRAAQLLTRAGADVTVLEGSDGVGGRVKTDRVNGYLLDRGFQVLLTAYPESRACLDYDALDLGDVGKRELSVPL